MKTNLVKITQNSESKKLENIIKKCLMLVTLTVFLGTGTAWGQILSGGNTYSKYHFYPEYTGSLYSGEDYGVYEDGNPVGRSYIYFSSSVFGTYPTTLKYGVVDGTGESEVSNPKTALSFYNSGRCGIIPEQEWDGKKIKIYASYASSSFTIYINQLVMHPQITSPDNNASYNANSQVSVAVRRNSSYVGNVKYAYVTSYDVDNNTSNPPTTTASSNSNEQYYSYYNFTPNRGPYVKIIAQNYNGAWSAPKCIQVIQTVTFDKQGGSGGNSSINPIYGSSMPSASAPSKTGYTFGGYYTGTNGSGTQYYSSSMSSARYWDLTGNPTLYAKWAPYTYTVSYNGNGNTGGSTTSSNHTYDAAKNLTTNGFTRAYTINYNYNGNGQSNGTGTATYTFKNWNTASGGIGTSYSNGQSVTNLATTNGGTVNLYALWNSGSVTLPTPNARSGYSFEGWYTATTGGTKRGNAGDTYTPTANETLYAQWTDNSWKIGHPSPANVIATFSNGTLTITGTGEMQDFDPATRPWVGVKDNITSVVINNNVTTIGNGAFENCNNLASATIPNSIIRIGEHAFLICPKLTSLPNGMGNSVQDICYGAFDKCSSLTSINIPVSVKTIGQYAFAYMDALNSVTVNWATPLTSVDGSVFLDINLSNVNLNVPSGTQCTYATTSVWKGFNVVGAQFTVTYAGNGNTGGSTASSNHAYNRAKNLTCNGFIKTYTVTYNYNGNGQSNGSATANYTFNGWATSSSGSKAYNDCQSVTNITTCGGTVTLYALWNTGYVTLPTPNARSGYSFEGWYTATTGGTKRGNAGDTYAPTANETLYAQWTLNPWQIGHPSPANVTATFSNGTLTITGTGEMQDFDPATRPWVGVKDNITNVIINNNVTTIGNGAFENCNNLASVTIPNSITRIGEHAFLICPKLTSLPNGMGNSVQDIWYGAFDKCSSLTSIIIPASVKTIGQYAFAYMDALNSVTVNWATPLTSVDGNVFSDINLSNVNLNVPSGTACAYAAAPTWENFNIPAAKFTITFNAQSGTVSPSTKTVICGQTVGILPLPTRTGYTFNGWYTGSNCNGTYYSSSTTYNVQENTIVYACWIPIGTPAQANLQLLSLSVNGTLYQNQTGSFTATLKNNGNAAYNSCLWAYLEKPIIHSPYQLIGYGDVFSIAAGESKTITITGTVTLPPDTYDCNMVFDDNNNPSNMAIYQFNNILRIQAIVYPPSSINEIENDQLSIFPNPAKDEIFIKSDFTIKKVEIYSLTGNLLLSENNFNEKISVSALSKGVYMVRIYTNSGFIVSKVVKE